VRHDEGLHVEETPYVAARALPAASFWKPSRPLLPKVVIRRDRTAVILLIATAPR
jgi:hypothetical protein